jgi:hypothetical protein
MPRIQPTRKGFIALSRPLPVKEPLHRNIFVERRPMNTDPRPDKFPLLSLAHCAMCQSWVPLERYRNCAAVVQLDDERARRHSHMFRRRCLTHRV